MNIFAIAAAAEADPKTVRKWLTPRRATMKPAVARRIAKAFAGLGYRDPLTFPPKAA